MRPLPLLPRNTPPFPKTCRNALGPRGRMLVIGTTCAGKTTLARALAKLFNWPHVEFDALFWDPSWQYAPDYIVGKRLKDSTAGPNWILDGNCLEYKDIVWHQTDTLIWLDYSLPIMLWRATKRTFSSRSMARASST